MFTLSKEESNTSSTFYPVSSALLLGMQSTIFFPTPFAMIAINFYKVLRVITSEMKRMSLDNPDVISSFLC